MSVIEVLRAARALPWCQGAFARTAQGEPVVSDDWRAASWCPFAAVMMQPAAGETHDEALRLLEAKAGTQNLATWNDERRRTEQEARDLFDRTIARLEVDGQSSP